METTAAARARRPFLLIAVALAAGACAKARAFMSPAEPDEAKAVARVAGAPISVSAFEARLAPQLGEGSGAPASSIDETKKKVLDDMVRMEIIFQEARQRGYTDHPDVVKALRQNMVAEYLQDEVEKKITKADVDEPALEAWYREHARDFTTPAMVRGNRILVRDLAIAQQIAEEAARLRKDDDEGFVALVKQHSASRDPKRLDGFFFLSAASTSEPKAVIEAAIGLGLREVSRPIATPDGYQILRVTDRKAEETRPFEEVKGVVQQRVYRAVRDRRFDQLIATLRQKYPVEIDARNVASARTRNSKN
jgi:parvulin-like peptidyl-prolyl isomerase